jgi:hypothetical protein
METHKATKLSLIPEVMKTERGKRPHFRAKLCPGRWIEFMVKWTPREPGMLEAKRFLKRVWRDLRYA